MRPFHDPVTRVLTSHALAGTAMGLPWPLLLVMVEGSGAGGIALGATAAARLAPYVALSWWVARLADRHSRDVIVRSTLVARIVLLATTAGLVAGDRAELAVVMAAAAVGCGTPAYPALAASMPRLAGARSQRATELLVTIEVASFVVGPALGGLLLLAPALVGPVAVALTLTALACYAGVRQPRPVAIPGRPNAPRPRLRQLRTALFATMLVNAVNSGALVTLLPLAEQRWTQTGDEIAYGVATALLGFGALGGPLLASRGRRARQPLTPGLVVVGAALAVVAGTPTPWWAALPLLLAGAAAVQVEAAATDMIQREAGDERSAGVLGLADTLMVSAGLVGATLAPALAEQTGAATALAVLGALSAAPGIVLHAAPRVRRSTGRSDVAVPVAVRGPAQRGTTTPLSTTTEGRASTVRSASGSVS